MWEDARNYKLTWKELKRSNAATTLESISEAVGMRWRFIIFKKTRQWGAQTHQFCFLCGKKDETLEHLYNST